MLDKLEAIKSKWEEVQNELSSPDIIADQARYTRLNRTYKDLQRIVDAYEEYKDLRSNLDNAREILSNEKDEDFRSMAKSEIEELTPKVEAMEEKIRILLIPKDPEDSKNAIVEIRAGSGGDEASIFAGDLYRMYSRYAENKGWKIEVSDITEGTVGGYKEIVFNVNGQDAYGLMKYESGVHRVQRVPDTESQGRVHTSAATVAVFPEADEFDIDLKQNDIKKETYCSSGPGGQSVNTTYSAVRLTHIPSGIVAQCQDQKSQIKNYDKAYKVLRSRIYEVEFNKRMQELAGKRKTMISSGDRSAKIRTYNYPQSRVTDHRIGLSTHNLPGFINGDIQDFIEKLQLAENAEKMKETTLE